MYSIDLLEVLEQGVMFRYLPDFGKGMEGHGNLDKMPIINKFF